jgi:hypothetical protein
LELLAAASLASAKLQISPWTTSPGAKQGRKLWEVKFQLSSAKRTQYNPPHQLYVKRYPSLLAYLKPSGLNFLRSQCHKEKDLKAFLHPVPQKLFSLLLAIELTGSPIPTVTTESTPPGAAEVCAPSPPSLLPALLLPVSPFPRVPSPWSQDSLEALFIPGLEHASVIPSHPLLVPGRLN